MPIAKKTRTISSVSTDLFEVAFDSCVRTLTVGSSWSILRIGCRLALSYDPGASDANVTNLVVFGLQQAGSPIYSPNFGHSQTGLHFLGISTSNAFGTRTAGPPVYYSHGNVTVGSQHDLTSDFSSSSSSGAFSANSDILNAWILQIEKGPVNYVVQILIPRVSVSPSHISSSDFNSAMSAGRMEDSQIILGSSSKYTLASVTVTGETARVVSYGAHERIVFASSVKGTGMIVTDFKAFVRNY